MPLIDFQSKMAKSVIWCIIVVLTLITSSDAHTDTPLSTHRSQINFGVGSASFECTATMDSLGAFDNAEIITVQLIQTPVGGERTTSAQSAVIGTLHRIPGPGPARTKVLVVPEAPPSVSPSPATPINCPSSTWIETPPQTPEHQSLSVTPLCISPTVDLPILHTPLPESPFLRPRFVHLTALLSKPRSLTVRQEVIGTPLLPTGARFFHEALTLSMDYKKDLKNACIYNDLLEGSPQHFWLPPDFKIQSDILVRTSPDSTVTYSYEPREDGQRCAPIGHGNTGPVAPTQVEASSDECPLRLPSGKTLRLIAYTWNHSTFVPKPQSQITPGQAEKLGKRLKAIQGDQCPRPGDTSLCPIWEAISGSVPDSLEAIRRLHSHPSLQAKSVKACAGLAQGFLAEFDARIGTEDWAVLHFIGQLFAGTLESGCLFDLNVRSPGSLEKELHTNLRLAWWIFALRGNAVYYRMTGEILDFERQVSALIHRMLPADPRIHMSFILPFLEKSDVSTVEEWMRKPSVPIDNTDQVSKGLVRLIHEWLRLYRKTTP